jgi:hypothetical protein
MTLCRNRLCVTWSAVPLLALAALAAADAPGKGQRVEVGTSAKADADMPGILVRRDAAGKGFEVVEPGSKVFTAEELISLPGSRSAVDLKSGVHLVLRGMLREFSRDPVTDYLMESAVLLHENPDFDLDLTLERGRIYVSNHKETGAAKVRIRFGPAASPETWDLTLNEPGSEVGIDLSKHYTREIKYQEGEEPRMELAVQVLNGKAGIRAGAIHFPRLTAPPGPGLFTWDNKSGRARGPQAVEQKLAIWSDAPPRSTEANAMQLAVKELSGRMDGKKSPVLVAEEALTGERAADRTLAVYCLGAMDQAGRLMSVLGEDDPKRSTDREKAIFTLRRWISRDAEQSKVLYDPAKKTGLLTQKYRPREAEIIVTLLHDFDDTARRTPETYELLAQYLLSEKVAIAELAYYQLHRLCGGVKLPPFNAAWPRDQRQPAAEAITNLVKDGKLPPP